MKKTLAFVLVFVFLLAMGSFALAENALVGRWEGIGSVYNGMNLDPMGEWVEFNEDMTGTLFMLKEFPFTYTVEGDSVHIEQEYGLTFEGKLDGGELILDNGIEYHFSQDGAAPAKANNTAPAAAVESFTYEAVYCRIDGEPGELSDEQFLFNSDGTGVFYIGDDAWIPFEWAWESDTVITLNDDLGDSFRGTVMSDLIIGVYDVELDGEICEFAYMFEKTTANGTRMASEDPAAAEIPAQGSAYNALCCALDGKYMECTGDALHLNADKTGTIVFSGDEYEIEWTQYGSVFSFTDESGDSFEGIAVGDAIFGIYTVSYSSGTVDAYEYAFNKVTAE